MTSHAVVFSFTRGAHGVRTDDVVLIRFGVRGASHENQFRKSR